MTKDYMARAVFEQPPVLDVILRNIKHEDETLIERDLVSMRLVFKTPAAVDVIDAHRIRIMQQRFRKRMFLASLTELLDTELPDNNTQYRRKHTFRIFDLLVENKDVLRSPIFSSMRMTINELIDQNMHDPVFRMRAEKYRIKNIT